MVMRINGTMSHKMTLFVAYTDDITLVGRDRRIMEEDLKNPVEEANYRGLEINQRKMHANFNRK